MATHAVKIEDLSPVKKRLSFEIPWEETKREIDEIYRKLSRTARIKGFRPGKVPRPILEMYYKDYVENEAVTNLINRFYFETLEEKDIHPLGDPELEKSDLEMEKGFTFTATVEVEPVIDPRGYTDIEVEVEEIPVTDEDVDRRIQQFQDMFSTMEDVLEDRGVIRGDFAVIDFQGSVEGEAISELTGEDYICELGTGSLPQELEDGILDLRKGESREVKVKYPEDHGNPKLAGREVTFSVTLKGIKVKKLPPLDGEFVKNFDNVSSIEELRSEVRKSLESNRQREMKSRLRMGILDKLLEQNSFEIPQVLVDRQILAMMANSHRYMTMRGMEPKRAAELIGKHREEYEEEARRIVRVFLLMKAIAAKEGITVDEGELEEELRQFAVQRGQIYEENREKYRDEGIEDMIRHDILEEKVFDFLESKARIKKTSPYESKNEEAR